MLLLTNKNTNRQNFDSNTVIVQREEMTEKIPALTLESVVLS